MALNPTGDISLGGSTTGQSIALELGLSATAVISLNDTVVRTLLGIASGAIDMNTAHGKSNRVTASYTFTTNTTNAALNVSTLSGYSAGRSDITITVNTGIYLWASTTANNGLTLTGGATGDAITLVNNGFIMGCGGAGGGDIAYTTYPAPEATGLPGGPAISLAYPITINNTNPVAYIGGGGGGGAGRVAATGGGGAGGANGGTINDAPVGVAAPWPGKGGAIGATGTPGTAFCAGCCTFGAGGGGGRVFPGTGGVGAFQPGNVLPHKQNGTGAPGGGGGGGPASSISQRFGGPGGSGNAAGNPSTPYPSGGGGGGGGWGAAGGTTAAIPGSVGCTSGIFPAHTGGTGGNAVTLNGKTVTWVSGCTTRVYGSVA